MDKYREVKLLGRGGFGEAWLVKDKKDGRQYALKKVNVSRMKPKEIKEAMNEISVLSVLTKHPCIVTYRESFLDSGWLCILMDFAEGGDMHDTVKQMKAKKSTFSESTVLDWFVQICLAMKHIHDRKILHRDLKTQNIFLTGNKQLVRVGDFGISKVLSNTGELAKTAIGTPYYLSPEICQEKPYDQKSDIWAMGCLLYELLTLRHAFEGNNMRGLVVKILRGIYPPISSKYSKECRDLVGQMLAKDPRRRPTVGQILKKEFIRERISKFLSQTIRVDEFAHTMLHRPSPAIAVYNLKEKPAEILKRLKEAHRRREEADRAKQAAGGECVDFNTTEPLGDANPLSVQGHHKPAYHGNRYNVGQQQQQQQQRDQEERMARERVQRQRQQQLQAQREAEERLKAEKQAKARQDAKARLEKERQLRIKREQERRQAAQQREAKEAARAAAERAEKQQRDERMRQMRQERLRREAKQRKEKEAQERKLQKQAMERQRQRDAQAQLRHQEMAQKRRADEERRKLAVQADIEAAKAAGIRKKLAAEAEQARIAKRIADQKAAEEARRALDMAHAEAENPWVADTTAEPAAVAEDVAEDDCEETANLEMTIKHEAVEEAEATMMRRLQEFKNRANDEAPAATTHNTTHKGLVVDDPNCQSMVHRLQQFNIARGDGAADGAADEQDMAIADQSMVARLAAFNNGKAQQEHKNEAEMTMMNRLKKFQEAREAIAEDIPEPLSPKGLAREAADRAEAQRRMEDVVRNPKGFTQLNLDIDNIAAQLEAPEEHPKQSPRQSPRASPRESPRVQRRNRDAPRPMKKKNEALSRYDQRAADLAAKELAEREKMQAQDRRKAEFKQKQEEKKLLKQKQEKEHKERLAALKAAGRRESSVKEMIQANRANRKKSPSPPPPPPEPAPSNPELDARKAKREEQRKAMQERMAEAKKNVNAGFDFELVLDKRPVSAQKRSASPKPPATSTNFELVLSPPPKERRSTPKSSPKPRPPEAEIRELDEELFKTACVGAVAEEAASEAAEFTVEHEVTIHEHEVIVEADTEDDDIDEAAIEEEADDYVTLMQSMHQCLEDVNNEEDEEEFVEIEEADGKEPVLKLPDIFSAQNLPEEPEEPEETEEQQDEFVAVDEFVPVNEFVDVKPAATKGLVEEEPEEPGLGKLIADGKTLHLPNVSTQDSMAYQIESLRMYLEEKLGEDLFLEVYRLLEDMGESDDEDAITQQVARLVGPNWHEPFQLVVRLLLCEDTFNRF